MEGLFDQFIGERWPAIFEPGVFVPPVEVGETPEEVFVNVQVPGLNKHEAYNVSRRPCLGDMDN